MPLAYSIYTMPASPMHSSSLNTEAGATRHLLRFSLPTAQYQVSTVLDLGDPTPETPDVVARRLEAALRRLPAARLVAAPDCGMKYLPRPVAFAKLRALVEGARRVG